MAEEKKEEGPNRIMVFLRVRPRNSRDGYDEGATDLMDIQPDNKTLYIDGGKPYEFDWIWHGVNVSQEDIFMRVGKQVIDNVFTGFWGTMMVYGQTGTGKSFTMCNFDPKAEGIIPRSMRYIFERIESEPDRKYTVAFSFIQIYLDKLQDLFNPEAPELKINRDKDGVCFPGVVEHKIENAAMFREKYEDGNQYRVITATKMNPESSRGHAALFIQIRSVPRDDPSGECRNGKLFLIDLAGYERFSKTGVQEGIMKEEAKTINASLLSLGNCVSALAEKSEHVPWRNAKLTRMLEDAIGGKAKCSIILTAGPSSDHHHETLGTLYFGSRAMSVKTTAKLAVNVDYQKLAKKLQEMLNEAQGKINSLEIEATRRQLEREQLEARMQSEWAQLKKRQEDQLQKLLTDGASPASIQQLIEANKAENELLEEQHYQERTVLEERHEQDLKEQMKVEAKQREAAVSETSQSTVEELSRLRREVTQEKAENEKLRGRLKDVEGECRKLTSELNDLRLSQEMSMDIQVAPSAGGSGGSGKALVAGSAEVKRELERRIESVKAMLEENFELKLAEVEEPLREELEHYKKLYNELKATHDEKIQMQKDALSASYEEEIANMKKNSFEVQEKLKRNHMTIKKSYQTQKEKLEEENTQLLAQLAQLTREMAGGGGGGSGGAAGGPENRSGAPSLAETVIMKKQAERKVSDLEAKVQDMKTEIEYLTTEKEHLAKELKEYEPKEGEERIKPAHARKMKEELEKLKKDFEEQSKELFKLRAAQALSGPQDASPTNQQEDEEEDNREDFHGDFESLRTFTEKMLRFPYFHGAEAVPNDHEKVLATLTTDLDEYRRMLKFRFVFVGPMGCGKTSAIKCLTAGSVPMMKASPEVQPTIHPTILSGTVDDQSVSRQDWHKLYVQFQDVESQGKQGGGFLGAIGLGQQGLADPARLHVDLVDLPGAPAFWRGFPSYLLPGKNAIYCVVYDLTHPVDVVKTEIAAQLNVLHAAACRNYPKSIGGDAPRVGFCLIGTHRDGMREKGDTAVINHLNKVTLALGDIFFKLRGEDTYGLICVGNFATSCKDWTVLSPKEKRGPTTFRELYVFLGGVANQLYNNKPSAFIPTSKETASHTTYMLGDDLMEGQVEKTSKLDDAQKRLRKGVVTLISGLLRESKVRWIMAETELRRLVAVHLGLDGSTKLGMNATSYAIRELIVRGVLVSIPSAIMEPKYLPRPAGETAPDSPSLKREGLIALDPMRVLTLYSLFIVPATLSSQAKALPMFNDKNAMMFDYAALQKVEPIYQKGIVSSDLTAVTGARVLPLTANEPKLLLELYCVMGFGLGLRNELAMVAPCMFKQEIPIVVGEYIPYLLSCYGDGIGRRYKLNAVHPAWFSRLQLKLIPFGVAPNRGKEFTDLNWSDASYLVLEKSRLKWGILGSRVVKDAVMTAGHPVRGIVRIEGEYLYVALTCRGPNTQVMLQACKEIMNAIHYEITGLCSREFRGVRASYQEMTVAGCESKRPKLPFGIEAILRRFNGNEQEIQEQTRIIGLMNDIKALEIENALAAFPARLLEV